MLRWLRIALACASLGSIAAGAAAGDTASSYRLKIERQSLSTALQEFARQSGIQIFFFSRIAEGRDAPALAGDYTLAGALERLLDGSGLTFVVINERAVEIRPLPQKAARRAASRKTRHATAEPTPLEEVVVVGTAEHLVATRIETPLREIPQTLTIVPPEQLRQQNSTDLADVLRHAPGITTARTSSLDQTFYARGFEIASFHVDGGAALNPTIDAVLLPLSTPDLSEFDHIEVLRGSDALFAGNGNPGGTVSLVRKRPRKDFSVALSTSAGSWNNYRVEADVTGPLAAEGAVRGRLDAVYAHRDYFYDTADFERRKIVGAVEFDLTPTATLTVGGSYQSDDAVPFVDGLPLYANGGDPRLPRDMALTFDWAYYRARISEAYLQYRQDFGDAWTLKVNTARWRTKADFGYGQFGGLIDPITHGLGSLAATFTDSPSVHTQFTGDATLTGEVEWFGWREQFAFGGDFSRLEFRMDRDASTGALSPPLQDVRGFDPANYPDPRLAVANARLGFLGSVDLDQYGVFASMRVYFDDAWSAVAGARNGSDHSDRTARLKLNGVVLSPSIGTHPGNTNVVTPYAGLIYDFNDRYSVYASYADIYLSTGVRQQRDGSALGAARGVSTEIGIKGAWRDGALNGALALYRIAQRNVPVSAPVLPNTISVVCCWVGGVTRSRGVDLELTGALAPGWLVSAGYSYNINEDVGGEVLSAITPRHLLKVWMSKELPGALDRWTVGGSLYAQSRTKNQLTQDRYALLDLRAAYEIDPYWEVALSVNNVFDKHYYESINSPQLHTWYGEPRNFMLRIDGRY